MPGVDKVSSNTVIKMPGYGKNLTKAVLLSRPHMGKGIIPPLSNKE